MILVLLLPLLLLLMMMNEQMHPFIMRNRGRGKERRDCDEEDAGFIHHSTV